MGLGNDFLAIIPKTYMQQNEINTKGDPITPLELSSGGQAPCSTGFPY